MMGNDVKGWAVHSGFFFRCNDPVLIVRPCSHGLGSKTSYWSELLDSFIVIYLEASNYSNACSYESSN
jgi:hypothetical protein